MTTYAIMQARIANELARSDLNTEIKESIQSAIATYETTRFWFNQSRALTFSTVVGQRAYGSADLADIPTMVRIDTVLQTQGGTLSEIDRISPVEMDLFHSPSTSDGKPVAWSWIGDEIHFWPTPNAIYSTRLIGIPRLPALVNGSDTNAWMTYGERLIRAAAKRILHTNVTRDTAAAALHFTEEQFCLEKMNSETLSRMPRGQIRATEF